MTGFRTLLYKELLRFWKVAFQTVAAPVLTALLYLVVFAHALEGRLRVFEEPPDFRVAGLLEVIVPRPHREECRGGQRTDDGIGHGLDGGKRVVRGNGNGDDDVQRMLAAKCRDGCAHRGAGRHAIVNEDHRGATHVEGWPIAPEQALAAPEFTGLRPADGRDLRRGDAEVAYGGVIEHAGSSGRNRAHRELLVARHPQLADREHVKRSAECLRTGCSRRR